jgi:hypothetical protein
MYLTKLARAGLLTALPLSVLMFGCGGRSADKVAADDWVAKLCDDATTFNTASDKAGEDFSNVDLTNTKDAKAAFKTSLDAQLDAQKDFRASFDKLGQPDIEDGDKVVDAFVAEFKANDKVTEDVGKAVADIDDKADFLDEFLKIADNFDTPDFRDRLSPLAEGNDDVQALIDKIDADQDCSSVIFDSSPADDTSTVDPTPGGSATSVAKSTPSTASPPKTANEKWVATVCTSMTNWVDSIDTANGKLNTRVDAATDAKSLKQALVDFMTTGQTETKTMQGQIKALKSPDVKDGDAIQKVFNDGMNQLVGVFDDLVSQSQKVSTTSLTQTAEDVDRISQGIGAAFDDVGTTFDKLDQYNATELEDLFDTRPECDGLK